MPHLKGVDVEDLPKILLIGDSGTHKTFFTASCPKPFVFDMDKGMRVTNQMDPRPDFASFKDAPFGSKVTNTERGIYRYGQAYPALLRKINEEGSRMDKGQSDYITLGMDSLTTLSNIIMNHVLDTDGNAGGQPHIGNWGAQMRLLETLMDQLTAWPVMLVCTAHVQRNTNDVTQEIERLPLITGKLAGKIGLYFDEVWYSEVKGTGDQRRWTLITESTGLHKQAKTRFGVPTGIDCSWEAVAPHLFPDGYEIVDDEDTTKE